LALCAFAGFNEDHRDDERGGSERRPASVLSEEALILVGALAACGMLVLGVLELLWPTQPRRRARRRISLAAPAVVAGPVCVLEHPSVLEPRVEIPRPVEVEYPAAVELPVIAAEPSPVMALLSIDVPATALARAPRVHRRSALARHKRAPGRGPYVRRASDQAPLPGPPPPAVTTPEPSEAFAVHADSVVERCFALHEARRHAEVVVLGMAALQGEDGAEPLGDAHATAALWSVIALARQALGEDDQARAALEAAVAIAPPADRPAYQRQLAALADGVAAGLLAEADTHLRPESEDRLIAIRRAAEWLQRGTAAMPDDTRLADLAADTEALLWSTYERTVMALAQRQDFRAARRLLREALDDPRFPAGRTEGFHELFTGTFSGEIGQLTAQAIRSVQDAREADALGALQRAETLLGTLSDEALPPKRREEVDRRLWWGYSKLGERRVSAGEYEAALEPLFNALGYDVGPELHQQTRALLTRALDGIAGSRVLDIQELADAGDREAAIVRCDRLGALLRGATDKGLTPDDLDDAFGKVQRLAETLAR
jgi:tetratricopeptide (TPR) repeat protein